MGVNTHFNQSGSSHQERAQPPLKIIPLPFINTSREGGQMGIGRKGLEDLIKNYG